MYLSDHDLKTILADLLISTDNPHFPFDPADRIQPCSIDFLLSNVFWKPTSRATIDLRKSKLLELSPRRHWRRAELKEGEFIVLKPGEYLLGRTYEKFHMPDKYAGKIEGRSSFARMGLSVHCTQDFINPGWHGYMPLQLVNQGPFSIRISPYLPVCQMMLIKLSSTVDLLYGANLLQSKYVDDDGGPSYWWRDNRVKRLQERLGQADITLAIQDEILNLVSDLDIDIIFRFEKYADRLQRTSQENTLTIMENFSQSEEKRRRREIFLKSISAATLTPILGLTLREIYTAYPNIEKLHVLLIFVSVIVFLISIFVFRYTQGPFMDSKELSKILRKKSVFLKNMQA